MKKRQQYTAFATAINKVKDNVMDWGNPEFVERIKQLLKDGFEPYDSVSHGDAVILFFRK